MTQNTFIHSLWQRAKNWRPDIWTLLLLAAIAYVWFRPPAWVSEENRVVPDRAFSLIGGQSINLAQLRGKVVLVNVWATWCPYCRHEMPAMEAFYRDYRDKGFEIVALSQDDSAEVVARFMSEKGYTFPSAMADPGVMAGLGEVSKLPTSFVVDKEGVIRHKISGQVHYARLQDLVEPLLRP